MRKRSGIGTLEAVIGALILGGAITAFVFAMKRTMGHMGAMERTADKMALRQYVRHFLSCDKTMAKNPTGCGGNGYIETLQEDDKVLSAEEGTLVGLYQLKTKCMGRDLTFEMNGDDVFDGIPYTCPPPSPCSAAEKARSVFKNGAGTKADPYRICHFDHLNEMRNKLDGHYKMMVDIDASPTKSGEGWAPVGASNINEFMGSLDGNNHAITDLTVNRPDEEFVGLFGLVFESTIKDLKMVNCNVRGLRRVGCVLAEGHGRNNRLMLTNIEVTGAAVGDATAFNTVNPAVGLFAGSITGGRGDNIVAKGNVTAKTVADWAHAGAIAGDWQGGGGGVFSPIITGLKGDAGNQVTAEGVGLYAAADAGGVIGRFGGAGATVSDSTGDGTIIARGGGSGTTAGGLIGTMSGGSLGNSQGKGTIKTFGSNGAWSAAGGAVGVASPATITQTKGEGTIEAKHGDNYRAYAGGLVGYSVTTNISKSQGSGTISATSGSSGWSDAGGLAGGINGGNVSDSKGSGIITARCETSNCRALAGGLAGEANLMPDGNVTRSVGNGTVNAISSGSWAYAGGVFGFASGANTGTFAELEGRGSVSSESDGSSIAGGVIGVLQGGGFKCELNDSFSTTATVISKNTSPFSGASISGGLIGSANGMNSRDCIIRRSHASNTVQATTSATAKIAGGLVGSAGYLQIVSSFAAGSASANGSVSTATAGGVTGRVDFAPNSGAAFSKTYFRSHAALPSGCVYATPAACSSIVGTTAFQNGTTSPTSAMFSDWDFVNVWQFSGGYPTLKNTPN